MTHASILILHLLLISQLSSATLLLIKNQTSLSFDDVQANFTPMIKDSDQSGVLYIAEPLDACTDLSNTVTVVDKSTALTPSYVLIIRGGCSFEDKIRNAQKAGYKAAIVYDNEDYGFLISMAGNAAGVSIYGTFVSKLTGEILREYVGRTDYEIWLVPSFETSAWSIMAISFISLLAMSAVLATCFFVRRHRIRRRRIRSVNGEFPRMHLNSIRGLPTTIFNGVSEEASSTSSLCAICIEDYCIGDKLRILPCHHKFHVACVDLWLGQRKSFCPVCKRDARSPSVDMPASEHTPLLTPSPSFTPSSSFLLSSSSTTPTTSSYDLPRYIRQDTPMHSPNAVAMYISNRRSQPIPLSRSSVDLRSVARHGSLPRNLHPRYTHRLLSPSESRSHRERSIHVSDSPTSSFPRFASASSLPEC